MVQDEVLAQRLGLVPLTGSFPGLKWLDWKPKPPSADDDYNQSREPEEDKMGTDKNTVVLKLQVECSWRKPVSKDETDPEKLYVNSSVYARDIQYIPQGRQVTEFPLDIRPTNPDILLAKLRPGQVIDIDMHAVKGNGADHAKFSPVATATYRLLPTIDIVSPILGADAKKFARCFPKGVVGFTPVTPEESAQLGSPYEGKVGEKKAVVENTMKDTVSRECLRHDEFKDKVKLGRVRDHFIFSVESTGQFESDELFLESVRILRHKCVRLKRDFVANVMR